jgi:hypothetical protein
MEEPRATTAMAEVEENAQVVSRSPGRLRVRVHPPLRQPHRIRAVHKELEAKNGIEGVQTNAATGSVLVRYDRRKLSHDEVLGVLRDIGVCAVALTGGGGDQVNESGHSSTAGSILAVTDDLDRRLSEITGRKIDLRLLVPIGLVALGLRLAMLQGGLGLTQVPPFMILWYAWDAFLRLHSGRDPRTAVSGPAGSEG